MVGGGSPYITPLRLSDTPTKLPCCPVPALSSLDSGLTVTLLTGLLRVLGAGPRACLAGLSLGSRGFRSELKQGELGTSFYYNYSRCAVLHLSWSESLSSALKGEGAS